MGNKLRKVH